MKSLLRILQEMLAVWLLCLLAGSSCAVFYTQSNNNDFPRLGRRSIFTATDSKDGAYPRIGRSKLSDDAAMAVYDSAAFGSRSTHAKRGIFTASGPGFPRIGRAQPARARTGAQLPPVAADLVTSGEEDPDVLGREGQAHLEYPLGLLFFQFDKDGDKTLSREEFVQGMAQARQDGTLYR